MTPRQVLTVRISDAGLDKLDGYAADHEVSRAAVVRAMFAVALRRPADLDAMLSTVKELD